MSARSQAALSTCGENLKTHGKDFCEETSLNGWFYLAKKNLSWPRRLFWIIVILMSTTGAIFFNLQFLTEFLDLTVLITVKSISASLGNVVFPAIVVCNHNQVVSRPGQSQGLL